MLTLVTFGDLAIREGDQPVDTSPIRKPLALLAVLAASNGNGVSRDRLQALFWPESDASRAKAGLKQAQYMIRRALNADPFVARGSRLTLDPTVIRADVADFDAHLRAGRSSEAVTLYAGPFLDGFFLREVAEFEHWLDGERSRLQRLYAGALEKLASEAAQRPIEAAQWWARRAALDRTDARVIRFYIEALLTAGDRASALEAIQGHIRAVQTELEAEPDADIVALLARAQAAPSGGARVVVPPLAAPRPASTDVPGQIKRASKLGWIRRTRFAKIIGGSVIAVALVAAIAFHQRRSPILLMPTWSPSNPPRVAIETPRIRDAALGPDAASDARSAILSAVAGFSGAKSTDHEDSAVVRVVSTISIVHDSLRFLGTLRSRYTDQPINREITVGRSSAAEGEQRLGQAIAGSIAMLVDPYFGPIAPYVTQPPDLESYHHLYRMLYQGYLTLPVTRADTEFRWFGVWAARALANQNRCEESMALLRAIYMGRAGASVPRVEGGYGDVIVARCTGNWKTVAQRAVELRDLVPSSELLASIAAQALLQSREPEKALKVALDTPDSLGKLGYSSIIADAFHATRRWAAESAFMKQRLRLTKPGVNENQLYLIRPLVAAGHFSAVDSAFAAIERTMQPISRPHFAFLLYYAGGEALEHDQTAAGRALLSRATNYCSSGLEGVINPVFYYRCAEVFLAAGQSHRADRLIAEILRRDSTKVDAHGLAGVIAASEGDRMAADLQDAWLDTRRGPYMMGIPSYWRARLAVQLGDPERAAQLLKRSIEEGFNLFRNPFPTTLTDLHIAPDLAEIRRRPDIARLLAGPAP